jgi:hypothetical protein
MGEIRAFRYFWPTSRNHHLPRSAQYPLPGQVFEITPAMRDVGARLIEELSHGYDPVFVAEEVFLAMLRVTSPIQLAKYLLVCLEDQEAGLRAQLNASRILKSRLDL